MEDHFIGTSYYSNLSDAIRDGLRKILAEYKKKNEVEIAATLCKEEDNAAGSCCHNGRPCVKNFWGAWLGGAVYLGYGIEETGRGSWMITVSDSTPFHLFWNDQATPSSLIHIRSGHNHRGGAPGSINRRNRFW
ncbi:MAG: hypothetical protein AEth_01541 [Candidatus Argoarchaeum ethanivorans]|uniref:Uncharacterized protein n=1 Tax=Candidatus Argoarchaeum ethanivorans TaxID=2608793 RepID=A0A8B3S0T9_9EURY|nr:MAG: hypothetical protein AEth_01541 [Candidatus Argoarchaeum ethanivorans]